jgi:hypothetical protein
MFSLCLLFKRLNPHIFVPREEKGEEENLKIGRGDTFIFSLFFPQNFKPNITKNLKFDVFELKNIATINTGVKLVYLPFH